MNRKEHLLTILSEECAEVIQGVSKALRFGLDDVGPSSQSDNRENISNELNDLLGIIEMLKDEDILKSYHSRIRIVHKKAKVEKYLKYSKERGTLS